MNVALVGFAGSVLVAVLSLIGVIYSVNKSNDSLQQRITNDIQTHMAVTDNELKNLTREVREHNDFARRIPRVEDDVALLKEKVDFIHTTLTHRIDSTDDNLRKLHEDYRRRVDHWDAKTV